MQPITVNVGPNAAAGAASPLVRLDNWSVGTVGVQVDVTGTINCSVQASFDDPNDPVTPVDVANMVWKAVADANLANISADVQGSVAPIPLFLRLLVNSGSGSARMTVVQAGSPVL